MEKLKFALFSIVTLTLLGLFGYWAVVTLQSGTEHMTSEKVKALQKENEDLRLQIQSQKDQIADLQSNVVATPSVPVVVDNDPMPTPTVSKYKDLISELQKLVDGKVFLKLKSQGPSVGVVQKFLNIYNKTSNKVDNDYGASTKTAVAAFQKAVGLTADGEAGPTTFSKMIDWLKKQN